MGRKAITFDVAAARQDRSKGWTLQRIADKYGVSVTTAFHRLNEPVVVSEGISNVTFDEGMPEPAYQPAYTTAQARAMALERPGPRPGHLNIPSTVEEAIEQFNDLIGYSGKPPMTPTDLPAKLGGERKILLLNDIHAPFHDLEAIKKAVTEQAYDTDVLLIGGDLLDLFSVSRYEKFESPFSTEEEFRSGKGLLSYFSSIFRKIRIMPGNHDERWKKYLMTKRNLSPADVIAMNYLIREAVGDQDLDITDPIYCLTRDLENVEVVKPVRRDFAKFTFFMQEGDLIVSHAEKFSRITGQAANQAVQWFMSCARPMNLVDPFRVFAQCHTHQAGQHWGNFGVWTMECGCLCRTPDYAAGPKLMGAQRPSILGYSVFYQDAAGRTDMRRSRFIPIEG
jgi:hypothetical protein